MLSTKLKEAAGNSADATLYVDDVFSTYLYTGNGSTQTITNGIDLAGKGGLVWIKERDAAFNHILTDTARGVSKFLYSDQVNSQETYAGYGVTSFNSTGFAVTDTTVYGVNKNAATYVSWTFRKAAKFFDVVTYTGNGVAGRQIAHSLGVAPGMVIVKRTDTTENWKVGIRGIYNLCLNLTDAEGATTFSGGNTGSYTSTTFTLNSYASSLSAVNASGATYVAYLFAHDTSSTGIIQCGSYTGNGSATGPVVTLGWEPQYVLIKNASDVGNWVTSDVMRNWSQTNAALLYANLSNSEATNANTKPIATGFQINDTSSSVNTSGATYIYMAIRRPNKPPTSGTQVFSPQAYTGNATANRNVTTGFPVDMLWGKDRNQVQNNALFDRLRNLNELYTNLSIAEVSRVDKSRIYGFDTSNGILLGSNDQFNGASANDYFYGFKRAPGFFDEVCYTGNGGASQNVNHNLTIAPDLLIVKSRSQARLWAVYVSSLGASNAMQLNFDYASAASGYWNSTTPTSSVFTVGNTANTNGSAENYVAYLFATLAGISKVGSYTGNGTSQNIECGFAAGARFFLVKATSTTGSWWVWDSARGITAGNDPALQLNSTAAEITTADAVDPYSPGITVNQEATCSINANGVSYIFLAVA